ncbi:MAG TPA: endonuclease V [Nitrososphaera sp.]|jgi:deoxyribonuclease V
MQDATRLQKEIAKKVVTHDDFDSIHRICGVDVAYDGNIAYCSAVVMEGQEGEWQGGGSAVVDSADLQTDVKFPYIPGLLMLREAEPMIRTLAMLKKGYDLLLVDGHGRLHPRKCGLACYVGVTLDKPTIGIGKSRLCGTVRPDSFVEMKGEILGYAISKKLYVSIGHRISLESAIAIVQKLGIEPLRLADINSKAQKRRGKGLKP